MVQTHTDLERHFGTHSVKILWVEFPFLLIVFHGIKPYDCDVFTLCLHLVAKLTVAFEFIIYRAAKSHRQITEGVERVIATVCSMPWAFFTFICGGQCAELGKGSLKEIQPLLMKPT